jgi:hypothetical protein
MAKIQSIGSKRAKIEGQAIDGSNFHESDEYRAGKPAAKRLGGGGTGTSAGGTPGRAATKLGVDPSE